MLLHQVRLFLFRHDRFDLGRLPMRSRRCPKTGAPQRTEHSGRLRVEPAFIWDGECHDEGTAQASAVPGFPVDGTAPRQAGAAARRNPRRGLGEHPAAG